MASLSEIKKGRQNKPPRIIIYGLEGLGKSTWASQAPNPIFIPTEDGLGQIDTSAFPLAKSYAEVIDDLRSLGTEEHDYRTVVIDSADWLEPLIWRKLCDEYKVVSIEKVDGGYGKGYIRALDHWAEITSALDWLRETRGMQSIIIAHSKIKSFNDPENPMYDKYMLRLNDRANDHLMEWADAVLFATKKMTVSKDGDKAIPRPIGAAGGDRIIRTVAGPACSAKNRYNLPEELPLDYAEFAKAINQKQ